MNTNTFSAKNLVRHQEMSDISVSKPRYYTVDEFRRFCKADLTRLLKKHGRI